MDYPCQNKHRSSARKNALRTYTTVFFAKTRSAIMVQLFVLLGTNVAAQDIDESPMTVAIGGYSPVSYFTENKPELGSAEFSVSHAGQTYFLTSAEQVELFRQNPDKYRPKHKTCPYSLAYGMVLPLDPTSFKIVAGNLLLFHRSDEKDALAEWKASTLSEQELLRRAEANLFLVTF